MKTTPAPRRENHDPPPGGKSIYLGGGKHRAHTSRPKRWWGVGGGRGVEVPGPYAICAPRSSFGRSDRIDKKSLHNSSLLKGTLRNIWTRQSCPPYSKQSPVNKTAGEMGLASLVAT